MAYSVYKSNLKTNINIYYCISIYTKNEQNKIIKDKNQ